MSLLDDAMAAAVRDTLRQELDQVVAPLVEEIRGLRAELLDITSVDPMINWREACKILGISRSTLQKGITNGIYPPPSTHDGKRRLWRTSVIKGCTKYKGDAA